MNGSVRYSTTSEGLEDLLATGRSGCLISETESQGPRVYTMLGEIMAVVSSHDGLTLVERLAQTNALSSSQAAELRRSIRSGGESMALLSAEVSGEEMMPMCAELTRENLMSFLAASGPAWFESMNQLFVPGLQVFQETGSLLEEVKQRYDRAVRNPLEKSEIQDEGVPSVLSSAMDSSVRSTIPQDVGSRGEMGGFEDYDRNRMRGNGEFLVRSEHLDVVDLGSTSRSSNSEDQPTRFTAPGLTPAQVVQKVGVCNQLLRAALARLQARGELAIPKLQVLVLARDTLFFQMLGAVAQDIHGQLSLESLQHSLSMQSPAQRRRMLERGLLDLIERTLDLCAEQLDEQSMDRLLEEVAGFHQRLHR